MQRVKYTHAVLSPCIASWTAQWKLKESINPKVVCVSTELDIWIALLMWISYTEGLWSFPVTFAWWIDHTVSNCCSSCCHFLYENNMCCGVCQHIKPHMDCSGQCVEAHAHTVASYVLRCTLQCTSEDSLEKTCPLVMQCVFVLNPWQLEEWPMSERVLCHQKGK